MKDKKVNLLKVILIVILIVLGVYVGNILRKMVIVSELQAKLDKYQTETNVYKRVSSDYSELDSYERYYKDGVNKEVITNKKRGAVITQYTYLDCRRTFWTRSTGNIYRQYNESMENINYPVFIDYITNGTVIELFLLAKNKMTTETLNGKECYVIHGNDMSGMMIEANAIDTKVYIEKDTGILVKITSIIEDNGTRKEKSIKYEYSIGTVTDEDMKEPDLKNYKFIED